MRSDGELLEAWQSGDREAGNHLVDRHFDAITRFFRNKVCGDDDVAELVGQTFLGCTSGKDRFRGDASVWTEAKTSSADSSSWPSTRKPTCGVTPRSL